MKWRMKHLWYRVFLWTFRGTVREIIQEELTEALHPDFGWVWMPPDGEGYKYMKEAHADGWRQAFEQILAGKCIACAKRVFG